MFAAAATATASLPLAMPVALCLENAMQLTLHCECRGLRFSLLLFLVLACISPQPFLLSSLVRARAPSPPIARPACLPDPGWTIRRHWLHCSTSFLLPQLCALPFPIKALRLWVPWPSRSRTCPMPTRSASFCAPRCPWQTRTTQPWYPLTLHAYAGCCLRHLPQLHLSRRLALLLCLLYQDRSPGPFALAQELSGQVPR